MKKIKYIGNFTDGTGWAKAVTYSALSAATIYDVSCQEHKYNNNSIMLEESLTPLIDKDLGFYDFTVHHVLPTDYVKLPNTVNVGFLPVEATISNKQWLKNIALMDFMIVPDRDSLELLKMSGVNDVKVLPYSFNYERIKNFSDTIKISNLENSINFLFVGEFSVRKNIEALLRAFYTEFNHKENVNLVLKTSGSKENVTMLCDNVRKQCRCEAKTRHPIIITDYLSEQDLISITRQCHAFSTASHGEAWCYPALESMACGLDVIYPYFTGIKSYAPERYVVQSSRGRCYGAIDAVEGLYTSKDLWTEIDVNQLMRTMRKFHNEYDGKNKTEIELKAKQYDYRNAVGIKEIFE